MEKKVDKICNNCMLYNRKNSTCKVAVILNGEEHHMPVFPEDRCHMEELGIEIQQVRWWVEDDKGNPTEGNGVVKMEYPKSFFGKDKPKLTEDLS
jgi:hypothetical protein